MSEINSEEIKGELADTEKSNMSPLAPTSEQIVDIESASDDNNAINNILENPANTEKISYSSEELKNLRFLNNETPKTSENPALRFVERIERNERTERTERNSFMPAFARFPVDQRGDQPPSGAQNRIRDLRGEGNDNRSDNKHGNRQVYRGRSSWHGNTREGPKVRPSPSQNINIHLRRQEVKLHESENAWKPSVMGKKTQVEIDETEELYRQVRGILNKLTAKNFEVMLNQFKELKIDTLEKLNGVIDLVFDKAVDEPNFSIGYAYLCRHLSSCQIQVKSESEKAFFKRTLLSKCQYEFEQNVANKNYVETALKPLTEKLAACSVGENPDQCNEIKVNIIEEESNYRRRLVSTVQFIGELYKLDMLTTNIMNSCIQSLINSQSEEKLECVCKLLSTIGEKLETKPVDNSEQAKRKFLDLTDYMKQFQAIVDRKNSQFKVSSRIRFMLMDLLDLRTNNWKPKSGPKKK